MSAMMDTAQMQMVKETVVLCPKCGVRGDKCWATLHHVAPNGNFISTTQMKSGFCQSIPGAKNQQNCQSQWTQHE